MEVPARPAAAVNEAERQRRFDQQQQAQQLIQLGRFPEAARLLQAAGRGNPEPAPWIQLLDLQVRLMDEAGAQASLDSLAARLPAPGSPSGLADVQVCGALAGACYRLGQPARAAEWWSRAKAAARDEAGALSVFHSYRQVRLVDEALAWASERRKAAAKPDLWALDVAQLHEEAGHWQAAFDELAAWQCSGLNQKAPLAESRMLRLAEAAKDDPDFLPRAAKRARATRSTCPGLGLAVLGVLTQHGDAATARELAWELDGGDGQVVFELARDFAQDGRRADSQLLLDELVKRGLSATRPDDIAMLRAENLAALGDGEAALAVYRTVAGNGDKRAGQARLEAAKLLHRPLGRPAEALDELQLLLERQPGQREALRRLVPLAGALQRDSLARTRLAELETRTRGNEEERADLGFLALRLDWWAGRLTPCAQGLAAFLKTNTKQDSFNDAIDLMDLLAFSTRDSLAVAEAARADRLEFLGRWEESLALLHELADARGGTLAEWLDWRACGLAEREADAQGLVRELERFRGRHGASPRLDRVDWMELGAAERSGVDKATLRAQAVRWLESWPNSLLQDTVRRHLRDWEDAPGTPEPASPAPDTERPR